jgi:hypothetical protein
MAALVCLGIGIVCALVARVLLIAAAFSINIWWGLGVLMPFGPLVFRFSYPEAAAKSRIFGLLTLPFFLGFVTLGPGFNKDALRQSYYSDKLNHLPTTQYATEKSNFFGFFSKPKPTPQPTPSIEERRVANGEELAHLAAWNEKLRLTKRDLLRSDEAGNRRYSAELAEYNAALAAANATRATLATK